MDFTDKWKIFQACDKNTFMGDCELESKLNVPPEGLKNFSELYQETEMERAGEI